MICQIFLLFLQTTATVDVFFYGVASEAIHDVGSGASTTVVGVFRSTHAMADTICGILSERGFFEVILECASSAEP